MVRSGSVGCRVVAAAWVGASENSIVLSPAPRGLGAMWGGAGSWGGVVDLPGSSVFVSDHGRKLLVVIARSPLRSSPQLHPRFRHIGANLENIHGVIR